MKLLNNQVICKNKSYKMSVELKYIAMTLSTFHAYSLDSDIKLMS